MKCLILTIDHEKAKEKEARCIKSCEDMGYEYELYYGPTPSSSDMSATECCAYSHVQAWRRAAREQFVIMEYDAYWIKPIDFEINWNESAIYNLIECKVGHGYIVTPKMSDALAAWHMRRHNGTSYNFANDSILNSRLWVYGPCCGKCRGPLDKYRGEHGIDQILLDSHVNHNMGMYIGGNEPKTSDNFLSLRCFPVDGVSR